MQASRKILCLSGSLRQYSCNTGLLRYILSLSSQFPSVSFEFLSLESLPMYNGDLDPTETRSPSPAKDWPAPVKILREKLHLADFVFLAVSENNGNLSPVLVNAISWASRSEKAVFQGKEELVQPIMGKKAGILSCAGRMGGSLAQEKLRSMKYLKLEIVDKGEPFLVNAYEPGLFDEKGNVVGDGLKKKVREYVEHVVKELEKK